MLVLSRNNTAGRPRMVTIAKAARQVKEDLPSLIAPIVSQALESHPGFHWRQRVLDPLNLILLFITQVMHGNTAINHLRHLSPLRFTDAAYCKARARLPLSLVERVGQCVGRHLKSLSKDVLTWRGHRIWYADGTSFSMPDTPDLQQTFGKPGRQNRCIGFPVCTLLVLCDAAGLIRKTLALPLNSHDASHLHRLHDQLDAGDVLVYDRAGCSFVHLALLLSRQLHGVIRMHQRQIVNFRPGRRCVRQLPGGKPKKGTPTSRWIRKLGDFDQLVQWYKPDTRPRWMPQEQYDALPDAITVRELCYGVRRKGFRTKRVTLVTTLLDAEAYPKDELADQYRDRWRIEVNFRHLKQTMGMDVLKCRTAEGVRKELAIFVLVYNLVRLVMLDASQRQRVPLDRVSFVDALRWLCDARPEREARALIVNPKRPDRLEPRVVKRRPKSYKLMTKPRAELRKELENKELAA
jgi:hypothetical protein